MGSVPSGYQTPKTNWAAGDIPTAQDFNRIENNIRAIDEGSRTIEPTQVPSGNTGTLRQLLDWFANRIKAILGTDNWYDAPPATLSGLNTSLSGHKSATPIDHPDGSVTLAKLAASAMTSAGGTQPNRLAVTNSQGAVGLAQSALDAQALGGVPASGYVRIATGVYTGNDVDGRAFNLGFQPKFVRVYWLGGASATGLAYITEASPEMTAAGIYMRHLASGTERATFSSNSRNRLEVTATGFIVGSGTSVNDNPLKYGYIAIG